MKRNGASTERRLVAQEKHQIFKLFEGTPEPSLYTIKSILILDNDGERIVAKYYDDNGKGLLIL